MRGTLVQTLYSVYIKPGVSINQYSILRIIDTIVEDNEDNNNIEFYYKLLYITESVIIKCNEVRHLSAEECDLYNSTHIIMENCIPLTFTVQPKIELKSKYIYDIHTFLPYKGTFYPAMYLEDLEVYAIAPLEKSLLLSTINNIKHEIINA